MRGVSGSVCRSRFSAVVLGTVLAIAGGGFIFPDGAAQAQENADKLPTWRITNICRSDSAIGQCKLYEAVARQKIASSWTVIPPEWRESCLLQFNPPLEPSWRILGDCIDGKFRRVRVVRAQDVDKRSAAAAQQLKVAQDTARNTQAAAAIAAADARKAEDEARRKAETAEAARKVEDEARRKTETAEAARKVEDEARRKTETVEATRKAEDETRRKAGAEEAARKAAAEARRKAKAAEAARKAEDEARRKVERAVAARKAAAEARRKAAAAEAARKAEAAAIAAEAAREAAEEARLTEAERVCRNKIRSIIAQDAFTFETRRARIRKFARQQLDGVITVARGCPTISFRIEGHTDSTGDAAANMQLSEMRAQAVVDYLAAGGIDTARIRAVGYGEERPVEVNSSRAGRAANRRIQFNVD